ncbi:MAG: helix-turn-helix domain-containing protein [Janthinobacterium lividum]
MTITARPQVQGMFEVQNLTHTQYQAHLAGEALGFSRPDCYTILLVESASAAIEGANARASPATAMHFISPGQSCVALPPGSIGQALHFTDEVFEQWADSNAHRLAAPLFYDTPEDQPLLVASRDSEPIRFLVFSLQQEYETLGLLNKSLVCSYLNALLIHCLRLCEKQWPVLLSPTGSTLSLRFRQILERQYAINKTVTAYADQLNVTANYLSEVIKRETGFAASHHIRRSSMMEAQRLAYAGQLSMKETAHALGYDDIAHFGKLFKRYTGVNFSQCKAHC